MVTAGVYLVCRAHPFFDASGDALDRRRVGRGRHRAARGHRRARPARHQEGARVLDDQPARLHVPRLRSARLPGRGVHGARARLLQGHALPRRRLGHPRQRGQPGPAKNGRAAQGSCRSPRSRSSSRGSRSAASHHCPASSPRTRSSRTASSRATTSCGSSRSRPPRSPAIYMTRETLLTFFGNERFRAALGADPVEGGGEAEAAPAEAPAMAHARRRRRGARRRTRSRRSRRRSTTATRRAPAEAHPRAARDAVDDGGPVDRPRRARRGHRVHQPAVHQLRVPRPTGSTRSSAASPSRARARSSRARRSTSSR